MGKLLSLVLISTFFASCGLLGPRPNVVYHRPDITTPVNKVIIFPTTDFNGVVSEGAKSVNMSLVSSWGSLYGKDKVIPAGPVIEKITQNLGKDAYMKIVKSLDNTSAVEQLHKNPQIRDFISQVTNKLGNHNFALALISGGEKEYDAKQPVYLNVGMFDTESLTWKWITKIEGQKGMMGNWTATSGTMVSNSFDKIEELEKIKK